MSYTLKKQIRAGLPQVGVAPYRQVHAHSTGNSGSTAQNEADYMGHKDINSGFYTHVVGNDQVIQVGNVNRGSWDVGGNWNNEAYASVELIESHKTKDEFERDYKLYIEVLRDLAKQAGIPITVDTMDLAGIKTHDHCRRHQPNNQTDHVDPYPYLAKWGISRAQFAKDVASGSSSGGSVTPTPPSTEFNINNYHTTQFKQIILVKADYAYKEKSLSTKVGAINPVGSIFTVVGIEYSGKYPRFKLKSGLYITTRKDTVSEYTGTTAKPTPTPTPSTTITKSYNETGTMVATENNWVKRTPTNSAPLLEWQYSGQSVKYHKVVWSDGKVWVQINYGGGGQAYVAYADANGTGFGRKYGYCY